MTQTQQMVFLTRRNYGRYVVFRLYPVLKTPAKERRMDLSQ